MASKIVILSFPQQFDAIAAAATARGWVGQIDVADIDGQPPVPIGDSCCVVIANALAPPAGLATQRLLGVGTVALSAEFRKRIAARLRVDPRDVHAMIVGGEGDAAVPLWSSATVAGIPLHQWAVMGHGKMTVRDRIEIFMGVKDAFIDVDVALSANVAACMDVVEAILGDSNRVLPVGSVVKGYRGIESAWLALPCIVNAKGAEPPLDVAMNDAEIAGLRQVAV